MSRLVWNADAIRPFERKISKCAIYLKKNVVEDGAITEYEEGHIWNGVIDVSTVTNGYESTAIYAGKFVYDILKSPELVSGTIEAYTYPDLVVEYDKSNDERYCGIAYIAELNNGDYLVHLLYNVIMQIQDKEYGVMYDNPGATVFSWAFWSDGTEHYGYLPFCEIRLDPKAIGINGMRAIMKALFGDDNSNSYLPNLDVLVQMITENSGK